MAVIKLSTAANAAFRRRPAARAALEGVTARQLHLSAFHPTGTVALGADPEVAPADPGRLFVKSLAAIERALERAAGVESNRLRLARMCNRAASCQG